MSPVDLRKTKYYMKATIELLFVELDLAQEGHH